MIVDTHIHLDDKIYDEDIDDVLNRAYEAGVGKFIIPAADINDLPKAKKISETHENIFFTAGVHPYHQEQFDKKYIEEFLEHPKCIGVGECGLDYSRLLDNQNEAESTKEAQKKVFLAHIELSLKYKKPLIVHIRDANQDSFDILKKAQAEGAFGVLHCFNASELLLGLSESFYFGIGGVITFKNAKKLVEIIHKIPKERLLIETDGPYLTPHPFRGQRNEPAYCKIVAAKIAELLDMDKTALERLTTNNAKRLFRELSINII
ncbi:MAG: TatD DNase family protein [Campylobacterota bacterium]|nr:TatD DNase family protein [Campylobacterota bacterium]